MSSKATATAATIGARRLIVVCAWLLLPALLTPNPAATQQPATGVTLVGVVTDASSGEPVGGAFLTVAENGPRAIANPEGRFTLANVSPGRRRITVERFGYARLEIEVTVATSPEPLELLLRPDPLQIEGLTVRGGLSVPVAGVVVDALSGARLPWASLWLTPDAVREIARGTSDAQGVFKLDEVPSGSYLLGARLLGYESQYVQVGVGTPADAVEVRLQPDSVVLKGLQVLHKDLRARRNGYQRIATLYGADRLSYSAAPDAVHFLMQETRVTPVPCEGGGGICVLGRAGRAMQARVVIDELPVMGPDQLDVLRSYRPQDFYMIEVFGTNIIHVYTHEFVERRARRPRLMLPP